MPLARQVAPGFARGHFVCRCVGEGAGWSSPSVAMTAPLRRLCCLWAEARRSTTPRVQYLHFARMNSASAFIGAVPALADVFAGRAEAKRLEVR